MITDAERPGRALRFSRHDDHDRLIVSIWQEGLCLATVRLHRSDALALADLIRGQVGTDELWPRDDGPDPERPTRQTCPCWAEHPRHPIAYPSPPPANGS
ncbi:MAG TPA: hypothetical protein DEH05_17815 [Propionibacteriaceae bacterium]|nr:hypothetical protein [Propionibacteriaceae bacterium]